MQAPLLFGPMRAHPAAIPFALEVVRVNKRYATEVVAAHQLCPFLRDVDSGFGRFCVGIAHHTDLGEAREAYRSAENPVVHIVYPLIRALVPDFERFGSDVGRAARDVWRAIPVGDGRFGAEAPVIATFHPQLLG